MKKFYSLCLFVSAFLVSCSDADNNMLVTEHEAGDSTIRKITITTKDYQFEEADATRGITYTGSGVPFAWAENDTLGIFPDKGDQISFSMAEGVGTKTANVDGGGWNLKTTSSYTAYSPFNRWNYFRDREHILLDYTGQVEDGIADANHLGAYDFQASNATHAENGRLNFAMERFNYILILRLTIPQAGTYTALRLTADDAVFTTQANLSLGSTYSYTPVTKSRTISLGLKNVTTTSNNQVADFLIMLAPVDLSEKGYTVSLIGANGYVYKGTKTPSSAFTANKAGRNSITLTLDTSSTIGLGGEFETDENSM